MLKNWPLGISLSHNFLSSFDFYWRYKKDQEAYKTEEEREQVESWYEDDLAFIYLTNNKGIIYCFDARKIIRHLKGMIFS